MTYYFVQVFFSDIVGFTAMSKEVAPIEVMLFLDKLFRLFDELIDDDPSLWKVETIGEYMCTCC